MGNVIYGHTNSTILTTTASTFVIPANPRRRTIMFSNVGDARITLSNDPISSFGFGIGLNTGTFIKFCKEEWGDLPGKQWFAQSAAVNAHLGWAEAVEVESNG